MRRWTLNLSARTWRVSRDLRRRGAGRTDWATVTAGALPLAHGPSQYYHSNVSGPYWPNHESSFGSGTLARIGGTPAACGIGAVTGWIPARAALGRNDGKRELQLGEFSSPK